MVPSPAACGDVTSTRRGQRPGSIRRRRGFRPARPEYGCTKRQPGAMQQHAMDAEHAELLIVAAVAMAAVADQVMEAAFEVAADLGGTGRSAAMRAAAHSARRLEAGGRHRQLAGGPALLKRGLRRFRPAPGPPSSGWSRELRPPASRDRPPNSLSHSRDITSARTRSRGRRPAAGSRLVAQSNRCTRKIGLCRTARAAGLWRNPVSPRQRAVVHHRAGGFCRPPESASSVQHRQDDESDIGGSGRLPEFAPLSRRRNGIRNIRVCTASPSPACSPCPPAPS